MVVVMLLTGLVVWSVWSGVWDKPPLVARLDGYYLGQDPTSRIGYFVVSNQSSVKLTCGANVLSEKWPKILKRDLRTSFSFHTLPELPPGRTHEHVVYLPATNESWRLVLTYASDLTRWQQRRAKWANTLDRKGLPRLGKWIRPDTTRQLFFDSRQFEPL